MINTADLLKLLSNNYTKYNKDNVKITFKLDGEFKNGNAKYLAKITTNSGKVIFTGPACLTKDKVALFDESSLYEVQIEFEE